MNSLGKLRRFHPRQGRASSSTLAAPISGSRGRKRRRETSSSSSATPSGSAEKILYIMCRFPVDDPIAQALYAIDASSSSFGTCSLQQVKEHPEKSPSLYPVIEFRRGDYPDNMCVAMLGKKLYFFGGAVEKDIHHPRFSKRVFCIDTSKTPLVEEHRTTTSRRSKRMKSTTFIGKPVSGESLKSIMVPVSPMHNGKPWCYGFVASGKLYAIGSNIPRKFKSFEVYDPAKPLDGWTPLRRPPNRSAIVQASVVVGDKVIFETTKGIYSYHFKKNKWDYFYPKPLPRCPFFVGPAVMLEDTIYWDQGIGLRSIEQVMDADDLLERECRFASGDFVDHVAGILPRNLPSSWLHHMGDNVFCYVMVGGPPDPLFPGCFEANPDPEKCICSIIVFEVPPKNCHEFASQGVLESGSQVVPFEPKVLHAKRFYCRSKNGADHSNTAVKGCFSASVPKRRR